MNDQERWDLEWLKQRHAELQQELSELGGRMKLLETKQDKGQATTPATPLPPRIVIKLPDASQPKIAQSAAPAEAPRQIPIPPPIQPPIPPGTPPVSQPVAPPIDPAPAPVVPQSPAQPTAPRLKLHVEPVQAKFLKCLCAFCGGHIEFPASAAGETILCPHCNCSTRLSTTVGSPPPVPPRLAARAVPASPPPKASFEMRLGTYWLVRIGIVMLLTGLVFFGAYTYENFIGRLGPTGKVSLLYAASMVLLGFGAWWQRKAAKESLKNYAQVLFAGGLAAVYFTTYAAHHVPQLCIIDSALLDGALLLGWAGFMAWIADRKKSEVLALFAVGLAYYTSVITRVGSFTLYSNLVLTLAAVFFLVRNRWAVLSLASLVATYAAYGFWRFFDGSSWHWASPEEGLWTGAGFLMSYWLCFTAAVFLSKHEKFVGPNRAGFLTLNNGAFFTMFLLTMLQVHHGGFWKFSLGYGVVLLGLAALARLTLAAEPLTKNSYLTQGLLLATVGLITKFAGLKLALLLGTESVVLLTLGLLRQSLILQIGAYLSGALAVGWGIASLVRDDRHGLYLGAALGALMTFNAFWSHRRSAEEDEYPIQPAPAYFTILALATWLATTWYNTTPANFPLALAVEALALTFSIYLLRLREMVLLGQGYLLLGQFAWLWHFFQPLASPPWWNPALIIAVTVGLSHWWQRQKVLGTESRGPWLWQGLYAFALVGVLYFWLNPLVGAPAWLMLTSLLAIGITAYGVFTRLWFLAAFGQIFLLVSGVQFVWQLSQAKPQWHFPLAPIAAFVLLSFGAVRWFRHKPDADEQVRTPLLLIALLYRWVALVMSIWWVCEYIPARERIWLLALLGLWMFLWAGLYRNREILLCSAAYTLTALALFWLPLLEAPTVYWPNLVVIVILLGQRQMARRLHERYDVDSRIHGAVIIVGGLSLWLFLTRWVCQNASGFYLTASWSALALVLFTVGMALRERVYRWLGLGVLAFALGRVVIFDVWKLETLYRILSFMALGIVLLVLGFIYNKYQEKIKEWL
jgi:uncharacterized membrane protein